jgi:hypothetical protein
MTSHEPTIELETPDCCSTEHYDRFRHMVLEAVEVAEAGFGARIARAEALAFLRHGPTFIGVGALKTPYPEYVRKVFKNAQAKDDAQTFKLEVGWVVIRSARKRVAGSRNDRCRSCCTVAQRHPR